MQGALGKQSRVRVASRGSRAGRPGVHWHFRRKEGSSMSIPTPSISPCSVRAHCLPDPGLVERGSRAWSHAERMIIRKWGIYYTLVKCPENTQQRLECERDLEQRIVAQTRESKGFQSKMKRSRCREEGPGCLA